MFPTPQTHPDLGWKRLVGRLPNGAQLNYGHVVFAVAQRGSQYLIYAISEANSQRFEWVCSNPDRAIARVIDWARQYAG
jgi:hypothetical protein